MRLSFARMAAWLPGHKLPARAEPLAAILDSILYGRDERAVSRRIALIAFVVRILSAVVAYFSQVLLARWMGDFQYGIFVVVWVGAVILGGLACLGFETALLRFVPEYIERGDGRLLRGVLLGSRVQGFLAATAFAVIGTLGLYAFGDMLSSYYVVPLYLGAITLPMLAIGEIHDGMSRAFNWAAIGLWPTFIVRPVLIIIFMWAAIRYGAEADAVTAMGAVIAATYLTSVGQLLWLERRIRTVVPTGPRNYQLLTWAAIAFPIFLVEGFFNLLTNIDILIVGYYMAPDQVGIYFAAAKTLALVHFVHFAVRAGGAQRFSQYYASGDRARLEAFVRDTLHWTFWPSVTMIVLLLVAGKHLLLLFGPDFAEGYPLLYIFAIGLLFRASIGPAESLLTMAGQQRACAAVYTVTFIFNVVLNVNLIPSFGLVGAASATSIALVGVSLLLYWLTAKRLGIRCSIISALRSPRLPVIEAR